MAAKNASGYGFGNEGQTVDIDEVEREGSKIVTGLTAEDPISLDDKSGTDAVPEEETEDGETQVAKKPRTEKAENGESAVPEDSAYGVSTDEGIVEKDETEQEPLLGHNGTAEDEEKDEEGDEEEDFENGAAGGAEEEEHTDEAVTGKDAPGDVGLRTLLQEGDNTKTSILNHADLGDAAHMLNGAK